MIQTSLLVSREHYLRQKGQKGLTHRLGDFEVLVYTVCLHFKSPAQILLSMLL